MAEIHGDQNIVIQNVTGSTITLNINGDIEKVIDRKLEALLDFFKTHALNSFQSAEKIYNIGTITNANFDFIVAQSNFQGLSQDMKENPVAEEGWAMSLWQELKKRHVPANNNRIFEHYGWLIEAFLQKMSTEVGKATTLRALSFMTEAYQASLYYLCALQFAQLLQQKTPLNNPIFSDFLKTPPEHQPLFDFQQLLLLGAEALGENNFVEEMLGFVEEVRDTQSDLYGVTLYLDKVRRQLIHNQLKEDEMLPHLLEEYRTALIYWLRKMSFIAHYRLVSMKEIFVQYRLGSENKEFVHLYGELHGIYESNSGGEDYTTLAVKEAFTYNHSVLLFKGMNLDVSLNEMYKNQNYISLSPLIIDQSVFSEKHTQTPEVFYFTGKIGRNYHFAQYKNELPTGGQKTLVSNKSLTVKKENLKQPKLNELFEHLEQVLKPFL